MKNNVPFTGLINDILRTVRLYLLYWLNFTDEVERLVEEDRFTVESATELCRAKEQKLKLSSHVAMIEFACKELAKEWPTGEGPSDQCAIVMQSSKRPAVDDSLDVAPGLRSGSERTKKRLRKDK